MTELGERPDSKAFFKSSREPFEAAVITWNTLSLMLSDRRKNNWNCSTIFTREDQKRSQKFDRQIFRPKISGQDIFPQPLSSFSSSYPSEQHKCSIATIPRRLILLAMWIASAFLLLLLVCTAPFHIFSSYNCKSILRATMIWLALAHVLDDYKNLTWWGRESFNEKGST